MQNILGETSKIQLHIIFNYDLEIGIYINVYVIFFPLHIHLNNTFLTISFENIRRNIIMGVEIGLFYTTLPAY